MSVLVICVNYHSHAETVRYVRSLAALTRAPDVLRIVVVDNSGGSDPFCMADDLQGRVTVVRPGQNLGYFGGAAFGFRAALAEGANPEFCIVSNVDLAIEQPEFLDILSRVRGPDIGAIAPSIRSRMTGVDQNPYMARRPSSQSMQRYVWLYSHYPLAALYERAARLWKRARTFMRTGRSTAEGPRDVYAPHGSFIVLTREFFARGGRLEYGAFLFNEELHVAEQARALGLRILYRPDLRVTHDEHVSIGRYRNRRVVAFARDSARYCFNKYFAGEFRPESGCQGGNPASSPYGDV